MKYESTILKRLIDTYGVVGNPRYISEIIKEFIVRGKERFPELFTYQADWLTHIDEFGLNPSYTVSYTGQSIYAPNTLERPVKSAILKGQTIKGYKDNLFDGIIESGGLSINNGENDDRYPSRKRSANFIKVEPSTTITFARTSALDGFHVVGYNANKEFVKGFANVMGANVSVGKINTTSDIYYVRFYDIAPASNPEYGVFQGDVQPGYTLLSVKMPVLTTINGSAKILTDTHLTKTGELSPHHNSNKAIEDYILIPPMDVIVSNVSWLFICFYDENKNFISDTGGTNINKFELNDTTIPDNAKYFRFHYNSASLPLIRFVNGTDYIKATVGGEPFKTNILTVNEEVELRGVGDVQDELDLLKGELIQNVNEIVLTGNANEKWTKHEQYSTNEVTTFVWRDNGLKATGNVLCDKLSNKKTWSNKEIGIWFDANLLITISSSIATTVEQLRTYLNETPFTVYYQSSEKSIKTVDLTILDQNGQNVKQLLSFNGGTHFNTGSLEGSLPPSVSVCVETDLEETLKVCSLEGNTM